MTTREAIELPIGLRRWAELTVIYRAFRARLPGVPPAGSGLEDVAALCKRELAAHPRRGRNVREQLLRIAVEWNLDCDRLEQQSDECLRAIAEFLGRGGITDRPGGVGPCAPLAVCR